MTFLAPSNLIINCSWGCFRSRSSKVTRSKRSNSEYFFFYSGCDTQNETFLHFKSNGKSLDNKSKRKVLRLYVYDQGQVKVRSNEVKFWTWYFCIKRVFIRCRLSRGFQWWSSFFAKCLEQPKINFENLTSSLQNSFFIITTPKNKLSS